MKPIWVELVNSGVANRFEFDDYELIEMNWRLTKYPKLYHTVFLHEIRHSDGKFKVKDFTHDMKTRTPGLFRFMIKHPSSLTQLLPFYWDIRRNKLVYDISAIASWLMIAAMTIGVFFLMRWLL